MKFEIADIVVSSAGRDIGQKYIIIGFDEKFVIVANGRSKKISNPKKKYPKHLSFMAKCLTMKKKIDSNEKFNDAFIRKILNSEEND